MRLSIKTNFPWFLLLLLGSGFIRAADVVVDSRTYASGATAQVKATGNITTSGAVVVKSGANVAFQANGVVVLTSDFAVESGGVFRGFIGDVAADDPGGNPGTDPDPNTGSDTEPPSVPGNLLPSSVTNSSFLLSWTPSTDNLGVVRYDVQVLATNRTASGTYLQITGLSPNTTYSVAVRAWDAAGNSSDWSPAIQVRTKGVVSTDIGLKIQRPPQP
jgi:hypothetical protein